MEQDLISIILPVFNTKNYLEECIESILNQVYKNIELIIVDDGSSDGSIDICKTYEKKDSRIRFIQQENGGLSSARNTGLDICNGDYICFIDADDYVKSDYIEKLYKSIKENNTNISVCGYADLCVDNTLDSADISSYQELLTGKKFLKDRGINTVVWNKMYNASIWKDLRFDIGRLHEDLFIMHKIMYNDNPVSVVKEDLYIHRKRNDSITGKKFDLKRANDIIEASENRINFFRNKEHDFYCMCLIELIDKLNKEYGRLYMYDKKKYKRELKDMHTRAKECYREYIFSKKNKNSCSIKNTMFIFMPNIITRLKILKSHMRGRRS